MCCEPCYDRRRDRELGERWNVVENERDCGEFGELGVPAIDLVVAETVVVRDSDQGSGCTGVCIRVQVLARIGQRCAHDPGDHPGMRRYAGDELRRQFNSNLARKERSLAGGSRWTDAMHTIAHQVVDDSVETGIVKVSALIKRRDHRRQHTAERSACLDGRGHDGRAPLCDGSVAVRATCDANAQSGSSVNDTAPLEVTRNSSSSLTPPIPSM